MFSQECLVGNQLQITNKEREVIHLIENNPLSSPKKAQEQEIQAIPIGPRGERQVETKEQQS